MNEIVSYKSFRDIRNIILSEKINIIAILVMFIVFFIISFNKWGELILFDNAREIVVPFLMSKGFSLYGDIYYFYSPLIPYFFALLIGLFGFHISIFYAVSILISLVYSFVLYIIARAFLNRLCSTIVAFLFIIQLVYCSNGIFSYIFPYSYASVTGSFLVAMIALFLLLHFHSDNKKYIYCAAFCCMLAFLVKQDFFISCTGSFVFYIFLIPFKNINLENLFTKQNLKTYFNTLYLKEMILSLFFIGLIPCLIFFVIGLNIGFSNVLHGIVPSELFTLTNPTTEIFYTDTLRAVFTVDNLFYMLTYGIGVAIFIFVCIAILYALTLFKNKYGRGKLIILLLLLMFLLLLLLFLCTTFVTGSLSFLLLNLHNVYSGFNLWLIIFILYYIFKIKEKSSLKLLVLAFIALSLNYRMFYGLTLNIYSFYYLPISLIIFVYTLYSFVPEVVSKICKLSIDSYKTAVSAFLIIYTVVYFFFLVGLYNLKNVLVRTHVDTHYTQSFIAPKYKVIKDASDYIIAHTTSNDKILIFPSFLIIYLFTDRLPASKYYYLVPGTTTTVEEELGIIDDIKRNKPKYILVHNNKSRLARLGNGEYEFYTFGSEYQYSRVFKSIESDYTLEKTFTEVIHKKDEEDENVIIDIYKLNSFD